MGEWVGVWVWGDEGGKEVGTPPVTPSNFRTSHNFYCCFNSCRAEPSHKDSVREATRNDLTQQQDTASSRESPALDIVPDLDLVSLSLHGHRDHQAY